MKLRKMVLASVASAAMSWSVTANAWVNQYEFALTYQFAIAEIWDICAIWSSDPYWETCILNTTYQSAQAYYIGGANFINLEFPDGSNIGETYIAVADALYYGSY